MLNECYRFLPVLIAIMAETCEKREFWLILDIEEDQSLVLVKECNVICDHETVKIGDKVKVIYNSEDWTGEVVLRGGKNHKLVLYLIMVNVLKSNAVWCRVGGYDTVTCRG